MKKKLLMRLITMSLVVALGSGEAMAASADNTITGDAPVVETEYEDEGTLSDNPTDEGNADGLIEDTEDNESTEEIIPEDSSTEEVADEMVSGEIQDEEVVDDPVVKDQEFIENKQFLTNAPVPIDVTDNPENPEKDDNTPPEDLTYSFSFVYQKPDNTIVLYPSDVTASKVVDLAYPIIFQGEGDYSTVTPNDNGSGSLSLGRIQWHGNRALYMVREIVETDPKKAYTLLGKDFYNSITSSSTSWASYVPNSKETALLRTFLQQMPKTAEVQDKMAKADIAGYINYGMGYGLRNVPALVYFADLYNQSPKRAKEIINVLVDKKICKSYEAITLNEVYISALANTTMNKDAYMNRRTRVYKQAAALGYPYCTSADSLIPCVTNKYTSDTYVGEAWLQWALNNYAGASLEITDLYDEPTKAAVAAFQTANGLTADGEAGKGTLKALATIIINSGVYSPANAAGQSTVITVSKTKWEANHTDGPFSLNPKSNNTLSPFTYVSADEKVVKITADGKVDPVGPGTVTVTISQAASAGFLPSSKSVTIVVYNNDPAAYTVPTTTLYLKKTGMKKNDVMWLQAALNTITKAGLLVDGDYGNATDTAVKAFQKKVGVAVDGEVGPTTRNAMQRFLVVANTTPKFTATGSETGVTLKWDKDSNASYYKVYRKTAGSGWQVLSTINNIATTTYTDKTGEAGVSYYYTVQSYYQKGDLYVHSKYDPNVTAMKVKPAPVTPPETEDPTTPGEYPVPTRTLKVGSKGDDVKWMQDAINQLLKVNMAVDGQFGTGTEKYVKQFQTAVGTVADGEVGPNTRSIIQRYLAVAKNTPKFTAAGSETGVTLKWEKDSNATYYKVYRKVGSGGWQVLATINNVDTLTYTDKTGEAGKTYYYTVQSYYKRGTLYVHSKYNPNVTAMKLKPAPVTPPETEDPTTPGEYPVPTRTLKVGSKGDDVKWMQDAINQLLKVNMAVDGQFGTGTEKYVKQFQTAVGTLADGEVGPNTRSIIQRYLAVAKNTPKFTATGSETGVTLKWEKDSNATYYKVYRKVGNGGWQVLATINNVDTLTYTDKTGEAGKTYYYTVQSYYKRGTLYVHSKYDPNVTAMKKKPEVTSAYPVPTRILKVGSKGDDVKWMQDGLNKVLGCNMKVDGDFGNTTAKYVKEFQTKYGLDADGVFGPASRAKLQSLYR